MREPGGMLRIGTTVMRVNDFSRAIAFWSAALGYVVKRPLRPDDDFMILVPADGGAGAWLALDTSPSAAPEQPSVHLDLWAGDAADQRAEVERLVGLGATVVDWDYPEHPDFVVLADTEGNRFCIIDTSH